MTAPQTEQRIVSGDWQATDDGMRYRIGYEATVLIGHDWNGWAIPHVTRAVAERIGTDQQALIARWGDEAYQPTAFVWGEDEFGGPVLSVTESDGGAEVSAEHLTPWLRHYGDPGLYDVSLGWTWEIVPEATCDEIVRADGTVTRAQPVVT